MTIPYPAPQPLTCSQVREIDTLAIEHVGIPGIVLMENAARSVAEFVYGLLANPARSSVLILCGPGNNGGDGFVIGRHLLNAGVDVTIALAQPRDKSIGDAGTNLAIYDRMSGPLIEAYVPDGVARVRTLAQRADVIVDALLGTGSKGAPRDAMADLVRCANDAPRACRIAVDIPSGLDADAGDVHDPCFRADATVTFVAPKVGFAAASAREVLGRVIVADIGVPRELIPG